MTRTVFPPSARYRRAPSALQAWLHPRLWKLDRAAAHPTCRGIPQLDAYSDRSKRPTAKRLRPSGLRSGITERGSDSGLEIAAASPGPAMSHSLSVPSAPPVARRVPSGLKAMAWMLPACPLRVRTFRARRGVPDLHDPFDASCRQVLAVRAVGQGLAVHRIRRARWPRARAWPRPRCGCPFLHGWPVACRPG